jgi:hypothetical protein
MKYVVLALALLAGSDAFADANCWCRISINDLTGQSSSSGLILGKYGDPTGSSFTGVFQQSDSNQRTCGTRCSDRAAGENSAAIASAACSMGAPHGRVIRAYAAVGTRKYDAARTFGTIQRRAAVLNCPQGGTLSGSNCVITQAASKSCPRGYWEEFNLNPPQCVRQACAAGSMPQVADWANIGAGNMGQGAGVYKTDGADGSRFFMNATASCPSGFSLNGYTCTRTYAAAVQTPAYCGF